MKIIEQTKQCLGTCNITTQMIKKKWLYIADHNIISMKRGPEIRDNICTEKCVCGEPLTIVEAEEGKPEIKDEWNDLTTTYNPGNSLLWASLNITNKAINKLNERLARLEKYGEINEWY